MSRPLVLFLFRQDLRMSDNPGLSHAAEQGQVLPLYIAEERTSLFARGAASQWGLHQALASLNQSLGSRLHIAKGQTLSILEKMVATLPVQAVYWNRCYDPEQKETETSLERWLEKTGIPYKSFGASLLWEPWEIMKEEGGPYKVYTPFYRKCLSAPAPRRPLPPPQTLELYKQSPSPLKLEDLKLLPDNPWVKKFEPLWEISEEGAHKTLDFFLKETRAHYAKGRDFPALNQVSHLSPHLHFGTISPHQVWQRVRGGEGPQLWDANTSTFLAELGWREFSYYTLYHFPTLPEKNLNAKFDAFPWYPEKTYLEAWKQGKTGYPLVDAGMRELWQTGVMHNRVRMVTASFLVKNLLQDWRLGASWFWDCLLDADLANNSMNWQWVAGCGSDAAPYFRIFNPVLQAQRFDPKGDYIRRFLPELAPLPLKFLFAPWTAPEEVLQQAGVELGKTYPAPVVDWKTSRARALQAYQSL